MNLNFKNFKKIEILGIFLCIVYLLFPIKTPIEITKIIDSPIGVLIIFSLCVYLFFTVNIILAISFLFAAYELIRRSSNTLLYSSGKSTTTTTKLPTPENVPYMSDVVKRDTELKKENPQLNVSLEEEVIAERAPVGISNTSNVEYKESEFKPITEKTIAGASIYS